MWRCRPTTWRRPRARPSPAAPKRVAVCFLFAYVNPEHEQRVGSAISKQANGLPVSLSSDVQPEFREYERFSTTVLNAYLQPMFREYLGKLSGRIAEGYGGSALGIYQSSGGMMSVETARRFPVRTALSGPAAGAVGAVHVARSCARPNLITLDMGGTSADVALIRDYQTGMPASISTVSVAGIPSAAAHGRHSHRGCRWRLHRSGSISDGLAQGRSEQRRRRTGPGLLRTWRERADGHRCQPRARDASSTEWAARR